MTERTCSLSWCDNKYEARGYCLKHISQIRTRGAIVDQSTWVCAWCGVSISHLSTRAQYCCLQHKKKLCQQASPGTQSWLLRQVHQLVGPDLLSSRESRTHPFLRPN